MQPATARLYVVYREAAERARKLWDLYMDARQSATWAPFRRYTEANGSHGLIEHLRREWHEADQDERDAYREWRRAVTAEVNTTILEFPAPPTRRLTLPRSRVS